MTARYWMAYCPTHGITIFGDYYLTIGFLGGGCLKCHAEDCPACLPKGAPTTQDVIADAEGAHVS